MQTRPDAILALDGLNMNPNGAKGTHFVSKTMLLGCLPLSQSAENPDMCLVGSQDMAGSCWDWPATWGEHGALQAFRQSPKEFKVSTRSLCSLH